VNERDWNNDTKIPDRRLYEAVFMVYSNMCSKRVVELENMVRALKISYPDEPLANIKNALSSKVWVVLVDRPEFCEHGYEISGRFGPRCPECGEVQEQVG